MTLHFDWEQILNHKNFLWRFILLKLNIPAKKTKKERHALFSM